MMLILQENASKGGPPMPPEKVTEAKERLYMVLSDPQMKLPILTTELARLAGMPDRETEGRMQTTLSNLIVTRKNEGFRAPWNGLTKALQSVLIAGPHNKGGHKVLPGLLATDQAQRLNHIPRAANLRFSGYWWICVPLLEYLAIPPIKQPPNKLLANPDTEFEWTQLLNRKHRWVCKRITEYIRERHCDLKGKYEKGKCQPQMPNQGKFSL
ncbi:hypothetical protein BSKO_04335 [Bryopsis sp. KO-2023]|nr:hypothetical protein BSKO_04335 [Bryopsis sp. KO-2023]